MRGADRTLAAFMQPVDGFSTRCLAVRDNETESWNTLYCRPRLEANGGGIEDETLLRLGWDERPHGLKTVGRHMCATLRAGFAKAAEMAEDGDPDSKVIIPVFGGALIDKTMAGVFAQACKQQGAAIHSHVVFEVVGVAEETALSWLDEVAIVVYLFCQAYTARVTPRVQNFTFYATCNYAGVSLDLGGKPFPADRVASFLADFVGKCEASRLKAYVHGIGTPNLANAVVQSGVRFMDGTGVTG